jgi:hypothetical protein
VPRFVRRQRERQAHPKGVAGFDRNMWPTSVGTGGRIASESVADLARITHDRIEIRLADVSRRVTID